MLLERCGSRRALPLCLPEQLLHCALENTACDADTEVENCLVAHGATMEQIEDAPFSPGVIENLINLPR